MPKNNIHPDYMAAATLLGVSIDSLSRSGLGMAYYAETSRAESDHHLNELSNAYYRLLDYLDSAEQAKASDNSAAAVSSLPPTTDNDTQQAVAAEGEPAVAVFEAAILAVLYAIATPFIFSYYVIRSFIHAFSSQPQSDEVAIEGGINFFIVLLTMTAMLVSCFVLFEIISHSL